MQMVLKELVFAGMLLASRDIFGGINWLKEVKDEADIAKMAEKQKKQYAGCELKGKEAWCNRSWCNRNSCS